MLLTDKGLFGVRLGCMSCSAVLRSDGGVDQKWDMRGEMRSVRLWVQ